MNLRHFSIALLISAIPGFSSATQNISLNQGDFLAAEKLTSDGERVLNVKLSKSGKAKLRKLKKKK
jgi:hypothetical protein